MLKYLCISLLFPVFLSAETLKIDLSKEKAWHCFAYDDIKGNKIEFKEGHIVFNVDSSAGPCLYKLDKISKIKKFKVSAETTARFDLQKGQVQGEKKFDDYALRAGVVVVGGEKPGMVARWFIPNWVMNLYKLAPKDQGLKHIRLFTSIQDKALLGRDKPHYATKRFQEKAVSLIGGDGQINMDETLGGEEAFAIWIMADGDDLGKSFTTTVKSIEVEREDINQLKAAE